MRVIGFGRSDSMTDVTFLQQFPRLQRVVIAENRISDFSPISALEHLRYLNFYNQNGDPSIDLTFLRNNLALEELHVSGRLFGYETIAYLKDLKHLGMYATPGATLNGTAFLTGLTKLISINLYGWGLTDFATLNAPDLHSLFFSNNSLTDISGLTRFPKLVYVDISQNQLTDLGDTLVDWAPLGERTTFNLSNNPLPCSAIDRARSNPNIDIQFDGGCGGAAIDAYKYDAPGRPYAVYHYALDAEPFDFPYELNGDEIATDASNGMAFSVNGQDYAEPYDVVSYLKV